MHDPELIAEGARYALWAVEYRYLVTLFWAAVFVVMFSIGAHLRHTSEKEDVFRILGFALMYICGVGGLISTLLMAGNAHRYAANFESVATERAIELRDAQKVLE
jgi:tellurite resistance protein TehA-like permease